MVMIPPSSNDRRSGTEPVRVALLDLYNGIQNQGMAALRAHLAAVDRRYEGRSVEVDVLDVRQNAPRPGLAHDVYVSTGGPGSPFDGGGTTWEARYFDWISALWEHNQTSSSEDRKHALFICHSFQLLCRHFDLGTVTKRTSQSFGIFPVHKTAAGRDDPLLYDLPTPFWAADFRWWQVVRPDRDRLRELEGRVLAREDPADDEPAENRAVMGVRLSPEIVGLQFHPEADPEGMLTHFRQPDRQQQIVERFGTAKYERLLHRLDEMDALRQTHATVVPAFLRHAIAPPARPTENSRTVV